MAITLTLLKISDPPSASKVLVGVAFSGNYPGAAGETLDLTKITNPKNLPFPGRNKVPVSVGVAQESLTDAVPTAGAYVQITPGAALNNWKLHAIKAAGGDLANAAYPAGFTGGTCVLCVEYDSSDV